jgi:hypothetical protein
MATQAALPHRLTVLRVVIARIRLAAGVEAWKPHPASARGESSPSVARQHPCTCPCSVELPGDAA